MRRLRTRSRYLGYELDPEGTIEGLPSETAMEVKRLALAGVPKLKLVREYGIGCEAVGRLVSQARKR